MMKKLIFCLLVMTGAGILNSCQQDEVVNEAPENKKIVIRASLPDDAQSRVVLGETEGDKGKTTNVYWDEGDKITVSIGGMNYDFAISSSYSNENRSTSAEFVAPFTEQNAPNLEPGTTYTFTYGDVPSINSSQVGTKEGLKRYHRMQATYIAKEGDTWNDIKLTFETQVALVEISLKKDFINEGNPATMVRMYDVTSEQWVAETTAGSSFTDKVYFSLNPGTYEAFFLITTRNGVYGKKVSENELEANKLYRIRYTGEESVSSIFIDNTLYVYGHGSIPQHAFNQKSYISVVILDGITKIEEHAFSQNESLISVTIPATVTEIEERAFDGCTNKPYITILASEPPSLGEKAFGWGNAITSGIYVPDDFIDAYTTNNNASNWENYKGRIYKLSQK